MGFSSKKKVATAAAAPSPVRQPPELKPTGYAGIVTRVDPAASPIYHALVVEALDKINSQPVGKMLLHGIAAKGRFRFGGGAVPEGYKVCIMRPLMEHEHKPEGQIGWKGTNTAVRFNEADASDPTKGTNTKVLWNPNIVNTPDGARPPFIALAHELIHALHNIEGSASADTRTEEARTVGLNSYLAVLPNENAIRREHEVPHRSAYMSEDFGNEIHDPAQFGALYTRA